MPDIVNIINVKTQNLVELSPYDFNRFINSAEIRFIFRDADRFLFMKDGFCYFTYHYGLFNTIQELSKIAQETKKAGFSSIEIYESAKNFGDFDDEADYLNFSNGGFFPNHTEYIEAKKAGFKNSNDFKEAKLLQIDTFEELNKFRNSEYYNEKYFSRIFQYDIFKQKHKNLNMVAYKEFKEAIK